MIRPEAGTLSKEVLKILDKYGRDRCNLISILGDVQDRYGYLPEPAVRMVAEHTGSPLVDVYGVATFYRAFRLEARGRHLVSVCLGTACHVRGAQAVVNEFEAKLGIKAGQSTADGQFTLETVNCLGACALGPIVVVDGHYFAKVEPTGVDEILAKAREGVDEVNAETDERVFPVELNCPRCNHSLMDSSVPIDNQPSIRVTVSFENQHGRFYLSRLYGSFNIRSDVDIPLDTVMHFFCPHCHAELAGASNCTTCGAPMVPMVVRNGGMIQVCARRGCREHRLDLNGVNV